MAILIDVDSTVADLMSEWLRRYNKDYNDTLTPESITDWDMAQFVKREAKIYDYLRLPSLYKTVKPIKDAQAGVEYLRGFDRVVFVSAGLWNAKAKFDWLTKYKFVESDKDFVVAFDKSLVMGDVLIDDKIDNIKEFRGAGILFSQPWNTNWVTTRRMNNWSEIARWF